MLLLCLLIKPFGHSPGRFLWELQILVDPSEDWLEQFSLICHGPERVSWHSLASFSDSPPPPVSPTVPLIIAYICILVKALL
jgi:hypothetical protein